MAGANRFDRVYDLIRHVPSGQVASYGMIASLLPGVTARMVGFAVAASSEGVPWQRIINSAGKISERPGADRQRLMLEAEGVTFSKSGRVDWTTHRWQGPPESWCAQNGLEFVDFLVIQSNWPG